MFYLNRVIKYSIQRKFFPAVLILLGVILFSLPVLGQPSNDECTGATVITSIPFSDAVNTTTATPDGPPLNCNGNGNQTDGNSVWYVWTPVEDITVIISSDFSTQPNGNPLDVAQGVFTGSCGNLTEVACVDVGLTDNLIFDATGGVTYYIKFGEYRDGVGGGNLVVRVEPLRQQYIIESARYNISLPIKIIVEGPAKTSSSGSESGTVEEIPMRMRDEDKGQLPDGSVSNGAGLHKNINQNNPSDQTNTRLHPNSSGPKLLQIFDGAENDDNPFYLYPPDTDGDVGPNHYVQMTNLVTTIYDKSGNVILGPFPNNLFFTGLGGRPENTNSGDPIVLYDEQTDRWLVSQFAIASDGYSLGIAISTTGDPTGSYYQYEFDFTAAGLGWPDYPKYGFVTDAIAVMANMFNPYLGAGLGFIDKAEALSPGPATMVFFIPTSQNEWGFVVGDNDGPIFDNMPPTFFTNNGVSGNTIDVWEITPDFNVPTNSTLEKVVEIPVSPFDIDLCNAPRGRCIDQPEGAPRLEAITDRMMHRLQLRDFGKDKRAVANHTIDADGNGKAGVRWYEFRNHQDQGWTLFKENTFSPDGDHRWMGSIAMNEKGETCLGYSISSSTTYPSIGVAGRLGESNFMNAGELLVWDGNVDQYVQLGSSARWGDYSAMVVDPVDGTFWYTQEYAKPTSGIGELAGWATKIVQVKVNSGKIPKLANGETVADSYALLQNYPNPFNPETEISFQIPEANHVTLKIFNSLGQEIRTLTDMQYEKGTYSLSWNGKDNQGNPVTSGVYFYKLQAGKFNKVNKMNLLR